ncbi:PucR family transcriptional regulator [Streptomyces sp. bgisy100]|uniref:PucR family transcriptional regulator n=1 Tax=Streptomyces sp. bgisy100 TaxID=3413783 RepID=UPI003D704726
MRPEYQDIVDEVSRLLEAPAILEERSLALIAFCAHDGAIDTVRERSILQRQSSAEIREHFEGYGISTATGPVRIPADPRSRVMARLCLPVRWQGITYGYLWLLDEGREIEETLLPRAMALASRAGALMATELHLREDLGYRLRDLISVSPEVREQAAVEIGDLGHVPRGTPVAAIALRFHGTGRGGCDARYARGSGDAPYARGSGDVRHAQGSGDAPYARGNGDARYAPGSGDARYAPGSRGAQYVPGTGDARYVRDRGGIPSMREQPDAAAAKVPEQWDPRDALATLLWGLPRQVLAHVAADHAVLLVPLESVTDLGPARAAAARIADGAGVPHGTVRDRPPLLIGVGAPRPDLGEAHASWQEARLATRIGAFLPHAGPVVEWERLGVYRLLARIPQSELRDSSLDPAVHRLFACGDPELIRTLEVYLDEAGNAQRSAAELAVHRQTLYYRLHKVEQITGLSLAAGDDRLVLHLGLKMGHLLGLLPAPRL